MDFPWPLTSRLKFSPLTKPPYLTFPYHLFTLKIENRKRKPVTTTMSSQQIANHQADAEIFHGDAVCKQKAGQLLHEMSLPRGLLPLDDLIEVGYNRTTGFIWLKQRKRKEHRFTAIRRTVSYDNEVTAFIEERRMWRLTGVKSKELLIWVAVSEIFIDDSNLNKITFTNPTGISRSFAVSAFEINE